MKNKYPGFVAGAELAKQLMPFIQEAEMALPEHKDKLLFFAGFMGHISGQMCAVIGGEASQVLLEAMRPIITSVTEEEKAARL